MVNGKNCIRSPEKMTTKKSTSSSDRTRSRRGGLFAPAKELPLSQLPFINTTVPEWLIVIIALLTAAACGAVAHTFLTGDSFIWTCSRHRSELISGRHAFTVGVGFSFVTLAAILALSRTIRHWLPGMIIFFGMGGIVTAGAGAVWGCHDGGLALFYSVRPIWVGCLEHLGQAFAAFFFSPLGIAGTFWSIVEVRRAHQSVRWPSTSGQVLDSGVKYYVKAGRRNWEWHVFYRYSLKGISFERNRVFFGTTIGPTEAISIVARFPKGVEVPVHYAPGNPGVSVLLPGVNRHTYSMLFVGPLFLWVSAATFGFFVL